MKFWNVKETEERAELFIDGEIVDSEDVWLCEFFGIEHTAPNELRNELRKLKGKPLTVWIDSYGGSVFAATGIYNALREHGDITTIIDGKAMSAGFTIALAGDTVKMSVGALAMAHNPLADPGMAYADELRKVADILDKVKETMLNIYEGKSNLSREKLSDIMSAETYMTVQEAMDFGFVDEVYENAPKKAKAKAFSRLAMVNSAQVNMDKLKEFVAEHPSEPINGEDIPQPVLDIPEPEAQAQPDALKEQRKHMYQLKNKLYGGYKNG